MYLIDWLTDPTPRPSSRGRLSVLIILIVAFFVLLAAGQQPAVAVTLSLAVGLASAEVAARLLGPVPARRGPRRPGRDR